jgi:histidyl-tRNA synthetase
MSVSPPAPVSGFPEWLPEQRLIEQQWEDTIRQQFESFGYSSLQTAAVEDVSVLAAKGEDVSKEIYGLNRLNETEEDRVAAGKEPRLALHFDLTVPMARYVAQNYNALVFPFKRYQIQKSWRGERAQQGRYREFTQADIDVIDNDSVSISFDAEVARVVHKILGKIGIENTQTHINNRKLMQGFYGAMGLPDPMEAIRIVDKMDKIGEEGVREMLKARMNLRDEQIDRCLELATIKAEDTSFTHRVAALGVESDLLNEGLSELEYVIDNLSDLKKGSVIADLSIARGLDYYTGTVYEGKFLDYPDFSTIYGGGRYDNLVGSFLNKSLPGVGISIGLTRIFGKLVKEGRIDTGGKCPTDVMLVRLPGSDVKNLNIAAEILRDRGLNVEVYHRDAKVGEQIKFAARKGIPYVFFMGSDGRGDEIKCLNTGVQTPVDIVSWTPDESQQGYASRISPSHRKAILPLPEKSVG